jgi:cathepsin A (carboxypeptidase C)/serine carboxypeptidase-like clade 1
LSYALQVGGYATRYENNDFTFITIKGGRHEVPETAPRQALEMLRRFLASEPF